MYEAWRVTLGMVRKLRQENPLAVRDWSGWTLQAADSTGSVVFSIYLDTAL